MRSLQNDSSTGIRFCSFLVVLFFVLISVYSFATNTTKKGKLKTSGNSIELSGRQQKALEEAKKVYVEVINRLSLGWKTSGNGGYKIKRVFLNEGKQYEGLAATAPSTKSLIQIEMANVDALMKIHHILTASQWQWYVHNLGPVENEWLDTHIIYAWECDEDWEMMELIEETMYSGSSEFNPFKLLLN